MSGSQYKPDSYVCCPYYCKESAIDIRCTGIFSPHITSTFQNARQKERYKERFCNSPKKCQKCPLYQINTQAWIRDHEKPNILNQREQAGIILLPRAASM